MGKGHAEPRHLPLPLQPSHWAATPHQTEIVVRDESQVLPLGYVLLKKGTKQAGSVTAAAPAPGIAAHTPPTASGKKQQHHTTFGSEQFGSQVSEFEVGRVFVAELRTPG